MAQYDGSVRINTKIDTGGFKDGEKEIEAESRRVSESVSKTVEKDTKQIERALERLKSQRKEFLDLGGDTGTEVYQEHEKEIQELQASLEKLKKAEAEAAEELKNNQKAAEEYAKVKNNQYNDLRLNVEEYAKSLKNLHDQGKFFGDEDYDRVYLYWKDATNAVRAYQAELNKKTESGQAKIAEQEARAAERKEATQRRAEEQAERALQKENARIQKQAENEAKLAAKEAERQEREEARVNAILAKEEEKRAKEIAIIQEEERLSAIREKAVVGNQRIIETLERIKQLEQEIADLKRAGVTDGYKDYDDKVRELEALKQEVRDYNSNVKETEKSYSKLGAVAKKAFSMAQSAISKAGSGIKKFGGFIKNAFSGLHKSASKSTGMLGTLASRFKGLVLSLLIFNQISKAFNAMISGMKEGFGNLYNEVGAFKSAVDGLKASSLTLKNSFAAAFRPLVEIAIPYIQRTIDAIANLMNIIGQFAAAITGQKTYTKAVKQTTAAIKDQTGAQNRQLSSLDKLNNLSSDKGGASGGGGAGNMFEEEVPIESGILGVFDKLKGLIENKDWEGLGAYIAEGINNGLQKVYDVISWNNVGPRVTAFMDAFTRTFNSLVDKVDWNLLGATVGTGINTIVNTLNLLIDGIDWKNLGAKISTGMRGLINEVDWGNLGNLLGSKFMIQWDIFTGFVDDMWRKSDFTGLTGWEELGISLGNSVNGLFEKIRFGEIGHVLSSGFNGAIQTLKNFIATVEWDDIAENITTGLNTMIHETDWEEAGAVLGEAVLQLLDVFGQVARDTDWEDLGRNIGHFLENIPWGEILGTTFDIIWDVLSGLISGLFDTDAGKVVLGIGAGVLAIAAFFNPAGALIAAIAGAAALIIANWDDIMAGVDKLKGWIEEKWTKIKEKVTGTTTELRGRVPQEFSEMHGDMAEKLRSFRKTTDTEWDGIDHSVTDKLGKMNMHSSEALDSIGKHIRNTWTGVDSDTQTTMTKTGRKIDDTWRNAQSNTSRTMSFMKNTVASNTSSMAGTMSGKFVSMKTTVASNTSSMANTMNGKLTIMKGSINNFSANAKNTWSDLNENMKRKNSVSWNEIARTSDSSLRHVKNTISSEMEQAKNGWNSIWDSIFGKANGILDGIRNAVSSAMNAISGMIGAINGALDSLFSKADSASRISVPSKGSSGGSGGKNSRAAAPRMAASYAAETFAALADTPIPGYANGQVIPTSMKRHLAVLGDNTRETEVVSPLSTMKQANKEAILEVLSELGLTGGKMKNSGNETFIFQVDGNTFFEITRKYAEEYFKRTGRSPYPI